MNAGSGLEGQNRVEPSAMPELAQPQLRFGAREEAALTLALVGMAAWALITAFVWRP